MDPNRRTTSLPSGMNVRILSTISRGGNIYGIDAEEVSKFTGIDAKNHIALSDWASQNDAYFYAAIQAKFSLEYAAHEAAAMGVPRVVLFVIPDRKINKDNDVNQKVTETEVPVEVKTKKQKKKISSKA